MAWNKTYTHTLLIGLDQFAAAVIFNRPDLTISTLCYLVMAGQAWDVKLSRWQIWLLSRLGPALDWIQAGHCKQAKAGDVARAQSTLQALGGIPALDTPAPLPPVS